METLQNSALRDRYIRENGLADLFSGKMPVMILLHYAPGDLLTTPFSPSGLLQFVVKGDLLLYDMPDENSTVMLQTNYNDVKLLGDVELLNSSFAPFFVEARSDVHTLAIHLDQYRTQLLNDPVFLRYVCGILSDKLAGAVRANDHAPLKVKVEKSLRYASVGHRIDNIAGIAKQLGVSNRQLLRVLREMCEQGVLEHEKKGVYRVLKHPDP